MREFFHGWRRKAGCVLLVLACTLMGMWIRGRFYKEMYELRSDDQSEFEICFTGTAIECEYRWETSQTGAFRDLHFANWITFPNEDPADRQTIFPESNSSKWELSLGSGDSAYGKGNGLIIPYSTSVLPLTLLSAYLILWKPRKSSPNTTTLDQQ